MSECVENIFANIANTSGFDASKIGELFRTNDLETRKFLIAKEFGSLDVINEDFGLNHIQENFFKTLETLGKSMPKEFNIDFDEFASLENTANLVSFFKSINVDLDIFSDAGFVYPIDVRRYLRRQMEDVIRHNLKSVKNFLYSKALNDKSRQSKFVEDVNRFQDYHEISMPNSAFFDAKRALIKEFGDWTQYDGELSADDIYDSNYAKMNPQNLHQDAIGNDKAAQTMIYFGAEEDFVHWMKLQESKDSAAQADYGHKVYEKFKDIVPEEVDIEYSVKSIDNSETRSSQTSHGVHSMKKSAQREKRLKEIGNSGELLVYNYLCNVYGKDNVEARSEAFVQLKLLTAGKAESSQYDIRYKDADKYIYVEVKTGDANRIYLSTGELAFAKEHADCYRVYHVTGINTDKPKFSVLPDKFWEDERYTMREIIESIEITF
jgi:hypothetical protein